MSNEFDDYIKNYRKNCDSALWLSGESSAYFAQYKAAKLAEWFPERIAEKQRILDFGCGDGVMSDFVSKQFCKSEVFGLDPSAESVKTAEQNFEHISFAVNSSDSTTIDFPDNSFDLIYSAGTFHHIPFDLHAGYMQELMRILSPNGRVVIFELNPLNLLTVITFKRNPIDKDAHMMTPWYTTKLAKKFGDVDLKYYCFFPNFLSWLRGVESWMIKIPFGALYAAIIKKINVNETS